MTASDQNQSPKQPASLGGDMIGSPVDQNCHDHRNIWAFGVGTLGRDMIYTLVSMYLVYYLTEVLRPGTTVLWWLTGLLFAARFFDAWMDFVMGTIVDNTRSRWGQYKPWIAGGAVASAIFSLLLFTDLGLQGAPFVAAFSLIYLMWGLAWTSNDIPYWSLLPALSLDQHTREKLGSVAKTFGTIGLFTVAVGLMPLTSLLATATGDQKKAWLIVAIIFTVVMLVFQSITLLAVHQPVSIKPAEQKTSLTGMLSALKNNDQLLWTALCMILFAIGYLTTTSFGTYFFKYAFKNEGMYSIFAGVLGLANLAGFITFPLLAKVWPRQRIYTAAIALILMGYLVFGLSPMLIIPLSVGGLLMFLGEAWIVMLTIVFLSDTIEYGQWKLGKRNAAVTFALQPFIWKVAGAVSTGIVLAVAVLSGIASAPSPEDVTSSGLLILKLAMLLFPALLIVTSYMIYRRQYLIDADFYQHILHDLKQRGQLN